MKGIYSFGYKFILALGMIAIGIGGSISTFAQYCAPGELETLLSPAGYLDTTFDPGAGANSFIAGVAIQPNGRVLIGGAFTSYDETSRNRIARLKEDGSLDTTFDPGSGANGTVNDIVVLPDGKILIFGFFTSYNGINRNYIARLMEDGSLDTTFNTGLGANSTINDIVVLPNGKILIVGIFTSYDGTSRNRIARLMENGSLDTTFNPGLGANLNINDIAVQANGDILIGGAFTSYDGISRNRIARLKASGALDTTFDPGIGTNGPVNDIAVLPDGKILIVGSFTSYNGENRNFLVKANNNGSVDNTFNTSTGPNSRIFNVIAQDNGKILIIGDFTSYNGIARNRIARLHSDSSLDTIFTTNVGANNRIVDMAIQDDGKIVIGGAFISYDGTSRNYIARLGTEDIQCSIVNGSCGSAHLGFTNDFPSTGLCSGGIPFLQNVQILNLGSGQSITTYNWLCTSQGSTSAMCIGYNIPASGTVCSLYTGNINNYNYSTAFSGDQIGVLLNAPTNTSVDSGRVLHTTSDSIFLSGIMSANAYLNITLQNLQTGTASQFVQYRSAGQDGSGNTIGGAFYGCAANERGASNPMIWPGINIAGNGSFYISPTLGTVTANDIVSQFLAWTKINEGFRVECQLCIGSQVLPTQTGACIGLPANAIPNEATSIIQFNNNGTWIPTTQYSYSTTASVASCNFVCAANYTRNGSACVAGTTSNACTGLPANAVPNTATSISQTRNGSAWTPSTGYSYSITPSATSCNFVCAANYTRNGSACVANTQTGACTGLPANAVPNTATSISQTRNGWTWSPSNGYDFNLTPSTNTCVFQCIPGYSWNGSACVDFNTGAVSCGTLTSVALGSNVTAATPNTCTDGGFVSGSTQTVLFGIGGCLSPLHCVQRECGNGDPADNVSCMVPYTLDACEGATTFTDPRDGNTYDIVEANGQCWFKEPLRYEDTEVRNMSVDYQALALYPRESNGTTCGGETTANTYKLNQEINSNEEGAGCLNLNVRDADGYGYMVLSDSPYHSMSRNLISYSDFTTRNSSTSSRTQSSLPSLLKNALEARASYFGRFLPNNYTVGWGIHPLMIPSGTLGLVVNYGPLYPNIPSINYISDSSYTALRNAGANGLSGTAIPTDIKSTCVRFWPGVTQNQITKVGYFDAYRMNCSKTAGTAPHHLTIEIAAATLQNKSFAYDSSEFHHNLGEFCPTGRRAPFETDYTTLTWTGRQAIDLKARINREGQYVGMNGIWEELKGSTQPVFVANGSWLGYSESNDSGSYNTYTLNPIWDIQATTPINSNSPTTKEMRCIKESAEVTRHTSGRSSCASTYCSNGTYSPSTQTCLPGGSQPTGQSTRTVTCRQGNTIIPDYFCTKIEKPITRQACVVVNEVNG